jgi:hypothetical protein
MAFLCRARGGRGLTAIAGLLLAGLAFTSCSDRSATGAGGEAGTTGAGGSTTAGGSGGSMAGRGGTSGTGGVGGTSAAGGSGGTGGEPPLNDPSRPGPRPLYRLTDSEYANTVRDLLGEALPTDAPPLQPGPDTNAFDTDLPVGRRISSSNDVSQVVDNAEMLAAQSVGRLSLLLPADCPTGQADQAIEDMCIRRFIERFGVRAYRRPLVQAEQHEMLGLYQRIRSPELGGSFQDGVRVLVSAFLQSPHFLYRWELEGLPTPDGSLVRLGAWEVASRLSYFLWASMPDQRLFEAAAAGTLLKPGRIAEEARRMLADAKARDGLRAFHLAWLGVDQQSLSGKDPSFTRYSPEIARLMLQETGDFAASVFQGGQADSRVTTLLTSSTSMLDPALAAFYGAISPGPGVRPVALDRGQRAGLFTQGSFLATYADDKYDRPFLRGLALSERVVCQEVPDPPPNIDLPSIPDLGPGQTNRQRWEAVFTQGGPVCVACHSLFNGPGFAFSHYDAVGAFRTSDNGTPVDARAELRVNDQTIKFTDAVDLMRQLAPMPQVQECVARHWVRWLLRRHELESEEPGIRVALQLAGPGVDLRELLVALTRTRLFSHRAPSMGEPLR